MKKAVINTRFFPITISLYDGSKLIKEREIESVDAGIDILFSKVNNFKELKLYRMIKKSNELFGIKKLTIEEMK